VTRLQAIADAAGLDARAAAVSGVPPDLVDRMLTLALDGHSPDEIVAELGPIQIRDGYRRRALSREDAATVAGFVRAARAKLSQLDRSIDTQVADHARLLGALEGAAHA
jgi:hypothetical protein